MWGSDFTEEDEKNGWIKTTEHIRSLPPWEFKQERYDMLKSSMGGIWPYAKKAYVLFETIEKERDDIVDTNIFEVFPYPLTERPYYSTGKYV